MKLEFKILGDITNCETIAIGKAIREFSRLQKIYGRGRWKKRKGIAKVRLSNNNIIYAEIHWYEAHGIGKREFKIKKILDKLN